MTAAWLAQRVEQLEAENAWLRERHAEVVAQLPATIALLEQLAVMAPRFGYAHWWDCDGQPHLEHLKALAKEAEVG